VEETYKLRGVTTGKADFLRIQRWKRLIN